MPNFKTAIVTGSNGFIGRALSQKLRSKSWSLVEVDLIKNETTVDPTSIVEQIYSGVFEEKNTVFFHVGADANAMAGKLEDLTHANINLTENYFEAASKKNIPTIFISSAAVYGNGNERLKLSPYAESKLVGEKILLEKQKIRNWPAIIYRLFNTYGPGEDSKGDMISIPGKFINSARERHLIDIWQVPETDFQSRDFIAVSDVVSVLYLTAISGAISHGGTFDLGTGVPVDFNSIADIVTEYFPAQVRKVSFPYNQNLEYYQTYTKARNLPRHVLPKHFRFLSVSEGIDDYVREILKREKLARA